LRSVYRDLGIRIYLIVNESLLAEINVCALVSNCSVEDDSFTRFAYVLLEHVDSSWEILEVCDWNKIRNMYAMGQMSTPSSLSNFRPREGVRRYDMKDCDTVKRILAKAKAASMKHSWLQKNCFQSPELEANECKVKLWRANHTRCVAVWCRHKRYFLTAVMRLWVCLRMNAINPWRLENSRFFQNVYKLCWLIGQTRCD